MFKEEAILREASSIESPLVSEYACIKVVSGVTTWFLPSTYGADNVNVLLTYSWVVIS